MLSSIYHIAAVITAVTFVVLLYLWSVYNSFIRSRNQVRTDFADIDVQLKRRAGLIQNLVEVVREYAKYEESTFENIAKARSQLEQPHDAQGATKADTLLTQTAKSLFAVSENYPALKANENFMSLQNDLRSTEDNIATYRETYNQTVQHYNDKIQTFPNLLAAGLFGFATEELFKPEAKDREDIVITPAVGKTNGD